MGLDPGPRPSAQRGQVWRLTSADGATQWHHPEEREDKYLENNGTVVPSLTKVMVVRDDDGREIRKDSVKRKEKHRNNGTISPFLSSDF